MAVTIAETSGHVTETELKSPLSPPVTMRRNDRSHSPKYALIAHLVEQSGVEPKAAKAVFAALETAILGSVHKKGSGEFTLPGLMKIGLLQVPAKKKRFGKDPFTGEERWFPAKPASVKIKTRALKKLKDATV